MKRLQRLRATPALRDMVSEIGFGQSQLIQPLFLSEAATKEEPISGLQGTSRHTLASLLTQFEKDLKIPSIMMGMGLPDDNLHAPNEKFHIPNFYRGIESIIRFFQILGDSK